MTFWIDKLFYERKGKFYSSDPYETVSPLINRINFIIFCNALFVFTNV